jgi:hypothetical protein
MTGTALAAPPGSLSSERSIPVEPATAGASGTPSSMAIPDLAPVSARPRIRMPLRFHGRGDDVVRVHKPDRPLIAVIRHRGDSNFAVTTHNRRGRYLDLLVNTIGDYDGTVLVDDTRRARTGAMEVTADGRWRVVMRNLKAARLWRPAHRAVSGHGDTVLRVGAALRGPLVRLHARYRGRGNFIVIAHDGYRSDLLFNEIDRYRGRVLVPRGTKLLEIVADGRWRFTRRR